MSESTFLSSITVVVAISSAALIPNLANAETITLYGNSAQPPKIWQDGPTPKGYILEISEAVLKKAGYDVEIHLVPFQRGLEEAKTNGVMTGIFHSPERDAAFEFSDSLGEDQILIATQKGKTLEYKTPADLTKYRVGALQGAFYGSEWSNIKSKLKLDEDNDPSLRMKKLVADRLDVGIFSPGKIAVNSALEKSGISEDQIDVLPVPLAVLSNHMVVGKGRPDSKQIIERINKAIAEINADGTVSKIMAKYEN